MGWWPLNWISSEIQLTCQCIEKGYIWWFASAVGFIKPCDNFKCQVVTFKFILVSWNNKVSNQIETFNYISIYSNATLSIEVHWDNVPTGW